MISRTPYPRRKTPRAPGYDYSTPGYYFITVCTAQHKCRFGRAHLGSVLLTEVGLVVAQCWLNIPTHFPNVVVHESVVMPNHFHGILELTGAAAQSDVPELGLVVGQLKSSVSRLVRRLLPVGEVLWQRNYYEQLIKTEVALQGIREYIINNPAKWESDRMYTEQ